MINILDKLGAVLNDSTVKLGFLPDFPDDLSVLTEYRGSPPVHSFGGTDIVENVYSSGAGVRGHTKKSPHSLTSLTATVIRRFLLYRKRQYSISDVTINSVRSIPLILKFTGGNFYGTLYRCYRQA